MFKFQCFQRTFRTKYRHFKSTCHSNKTNHLLTDWLITLKNNFLLCIKDLNIDIYVEDIYVEEHLCLHFSAGVPGDADICTTRSGRFTVRLTNSRRGLNSFLTKTGDLFAMPLWEIKIPIKIKMYFLWDWNLTGEWRADSGGLLGMILWYGRLHSGASHESSKNLETLSSVLEFLKLGSAELQTLFQKDTDSK